MFYHEFMPQPRTEGDDMSHHDEIVPGDDALAPEFRHLSRTDGALKKRAIDFVNLTNEFERLGREAARAKEATDKAAVNLQECVRELKQCVGDRVKERHIILGPNKLLVVRADSVEIKDCI